MISTNEEVQSLCRTYNLLSSRHQRNNEHDTHSTIYRGMIERR